MLSKKRLNGYDNNGQKTMVSLPVQLKPKRECVVQNSQEIGLGILTYI